DSVRAQSVPCSELILAVDYNEALYTRLVDSHPGAIVIRNKEAKGLSGGRNSAIAVAKGEIVAFLDDDAIAAPDWLKYLVEDYANPAITGVGGLTLPDWQ